MKTQGLSVEIDRLLEEARGFVRGHDFLGAQARARHAKLVLDECASPPSSDPTMEELRARVELELPEYDRLAREFQAETRARHAVFLTRERRTIEAPSGTP